MSIDQPKKNLKCEDCGEEKPDVKYREDGEYLLCEDCLSNYPNETGYCSMYCRISGNCDESIKNDSLKSEITRLEEENKRLNKYVISGYETVHKESLEEITRLIEENLKLEEENKNLKACIDMLTPTVKPVYLNMLSASIHQTNVEAGWWSDLATGEPLDRNVGELLCLVHSEVSEALEAYRKDLMDDKLPHRKGFEVELVDALIRIFDIAGKFRLDLDGALQDKLDYNAKRADHKLENRQGKNGKKF